MSEWNDDDGDDIEMPGFMFPTFGLPMTKEQRKKYDRQIAEEKALGNLLWPTLPVYTADKAVCAKCGSAKVRTHYCSPGSATCSLGDHDGMERQCKRCSYQWYERALDAEGGAA